MQVLDNTKTLSPSGASTTFDTESSALALRAPRYSPDYPVPENFAPLKLVLPHVTSFLDHDLFVMNGRLQKVPWGASAGDDPYAAIADFDTAPMPTTSRSFHPAFQLRLAEIGSACDRFWEGLKVSTEPDQRGRDGLTKAEAVFFLRYQLQALRLAQLRGVAMIEVLRSAGRSIISHGIESDRAFAENPAKREEYLERKKTRLIDDGVKLATGKILRIAPELVNYLGPKLEQLATFCEELNALLPSQELALVRSEVRNSVASKNSGRALVYHLALTIGALTEAEYRHLCDVTPGGSSMPLHPSEVMSCNDLLDIAKMQFDAWAKRKAYEPGNGVHSDLEQLYGRGELPPESRAFMPHLTLGILEVLQALGEDAIKFLAEKGRLLGSGGISPDTQARTGLSNGMKSKNGSRPVYFPPRVMNLLAFNLHANWQAARSFCNLLPDSKFHLKPHPADVAWDPKQMPTDELYDPDRLGAMMLAVKIGILQSSTNQKETALIAKLEAVTGVEHWIKVDKESRPDPRVQALHEALERALSSSHIFAPQRFTLSAESLQALTFLRRLHGPWWNNRAAIPEAVSEKVWASVKPHQRLFEIFFTEALSAEARELSVSAAKSLQQLGRHLQRGDAEMLGDPPTQVRIQNGKPGGMIFRFADRDLAEIVSVFERARGLAEVSCLRYAIATNRPELVRTTNPATDLRRLEESIGRDRIEPSDAQRAFERIHATPFALGQDGEHEKEFFAGQFFSMGRPGLQVCRSVYSEFSLSFIHGFAERFLKNRAEIEALLREDGMSGHIEDRSPHSEQALRLFGQELLSFIGKLGEVELKDLRRVGKRFLEISPSEKRFSVRVLIDQEWAEKRGYAPGPFKERVAWPDGRWRYHLTRLFYANAMASEEIVDGIEEALKATTQDAAWPKIEISRKPGDPWMPTSKFYGVSYSLHAAAVALAQMSDDDFSRLLSCSYDSGLRPETWRN